MRTKNQTKKKIVIAAGGTGGHIFPAQAFAQEFLKENETAEILFMGGGLSANPYFRKEHFPCVEILSATPFRQSWLFSFSQISKGVFQSFKMLKQFQPDLVVGFGSFHSFPILAAAVCKGIPIVLFESNSAPGKVNRLFSKWAKVSAIQFSQAAKRLSGRTEEVSMPLGDKEKKARVDREEACAYFGLSPLKCTLLVFGGSQGAVAINKLFCSMAELLAREKKEIQIIHLTGSQERAEEIRRCYDRLNLVCCVKGFEDKMYYAWKAASLAICRSGAATLAEILLFEKPAILIPYPYATENHQRENAVFLEKEIKGGIMLPEESISAELLFQKVKQLSEESELEKKQRNIRFFKESRHKKSLSSLIESILYE